MKVIIPAKANSHRVVNKNFRPFCDGISLVEITIKKLKAAGFAAKDIYVSSNSVTDLSRLRLAYKISTLHRDDSYCDNDMQLTDVIRYVTGQLGNAREVAWAQATCPTFNQYRECLIEWQQHKHQFDSLCVAFPRSPYALIKTDNGMQPCGWSFGSNHQSSQELIASYAMPFAFSILTRRSINETGYYIGRKCLWFEASESHMDIDTVQDFKDAQAVYKARKRQKDNRQQK